ncbi:hypothetical protein [Rhodoferax saidenbachensis]|uniref:Phospholipase n=1 Tax=Rhodoferax saidenbachensis TaxID=1484693 RepID=A0A1P8KAX4_9BURK|nr:hypothetical protein [Rhodoferax saidenbachensis]APW43156.1 hypothetical protein RS694_11875 [Rhodoferax saidenbachensis]
MKNLAFALSILGALSTSPAWAWGNHSLPAYRALEAMPEVANASPVIAEPLEAFLKAEEKTLEALLASQEAWAAANLENYPARPAALAFTAKPGRTDETRRLAFLSALRVAPNSKFALYIQPDPRTSSAAGNLLPYAAVNTLPEPPHSTYKFAALKAGDPVAPLSVVASAADEPDYGLDINLWDDSPSEWGKTYGFGTLPFGNPALSFSTQAPFHMGFMHESRVLYMAAPFLKRTFPRLRSYQYSTLAALAFRTGHPYWGWRFTGLSLHYLQDLTQPYHASLAPGDSTTKLLWANALAMAGMSGMKDDMIVLLSNRHLALEKYQTELLENAAHSKQDSAIEKALRNTDKDGNYPEWSEHYLRDVVSTQAAAAGPQLVQTLVAAMPPGYVSDPAFDFGTKEDTINLVTELAKVDPAARAKLDAAIAELLANFGAHSRNAVRGILKASNR